MAKGANIEILTLRSGATEWDAGGRLQGETDLPLSEQGRINVQTAALQLGDMPRVGAILTGTDEASVETAQILASKTGGRVRQMKALDEVGLGLWEGLLESELMDRYRKSYAQWREDPTSVTAPEGEPLREAEQRLFTTAARAMERADRKAVALVLRPLADAMVRCWLEERPPTDIPAVMAGESGVQRFAVPRSRLESLSAGLKAGA